MSDLKRLKTPNFLFFPVEEQPTRMFLDLYWTLFQMKEKNATSGCLFVVVKKIQTQHEITDASTGSYNIHTFWKF